MNLCLSILAPTLTEESEIITPRDIQTYIYKHIYIYLYYYYHKTDYKKISKKKKKAQKKGKREDMSKFWYVEN